LGIGRLLTPTATTATDCMSASDVKVSFERGHLQSPSSFQALVKDEKVAESTNLQLNASRLMKSVGEFYLSCRSPQTEERRVVHQQKFGTSEAFNISLLLYEYS